MPASCSAFAAGLPVTSARRHVDQDQVVVRAARDEAEAAIEQRRRQRLRVLDDLVRVRAEVAVAASFSATAIAAVVWLCGPPWRPGNTAGRSPSRAPRRTGSCRRAGRAASCASSSSRSARAEPDADARPRRSAPRCARCRRRATRRPRFAICAKPAKSQVRGYAVPPQKMIFGCVSLASVSTRSRSMRCVVRVDLVLGR